ncbi:MAG: FGGY family carbohydrate kinase, partial [Anaerolineales bacterium]|nr:FGGY family carbohydrate kinase [Anaerolineales bacterium]
MDEIREKRVPLVIGLDLGTTNCKAVAVTPSGQECAQSTASYSLHSPNPGWAVQETEDIWQGVVQVLDDLESQVQDEHIAGLCLSGAMHSLLLVNEAGEPLAPA